MAPRRQPYEHLNQPLDANASQDAAGTPTNDGGYEFVIEDDGFTAQPDDGQQTQEQRPAPEPVQVPPPPIESEDDKATRLLKSQLERMEQETRRLQARVGEVEQGRTAAEQGRTAAEERAQRADLERISAEEIAIDTALSQAERDAERAEAEQARLWEAGEYRDAAKAGRAVAEAEQ